VLLLRIITGNPSSDEAILVSVPTGHGRKLRCAINVTKLGASGHVPRDMPSTESQRHRSVISHWQMALDITRLPISL
jgi:hypothetical protein